DGLADAKPAAAGAGELGDSVPRSEPEHAESRHENLVRRDRHELERAARRRGAWLPRLLEQAVHVTDEGAVATAGEDRAVALVENLPRDRAGIVEAARVVQVLGRNEVFQLALERVGDAARVRVEEDCHSLGAADWKKLEVAHRTVLGSKRGAVNRCAALRH